MLFLIWEFCKKVISEKLKETLKKILEFISYIAILFVIIISIYLNYEYIKDINKTYTITPFKYIKQGIEEEHITIVGNYILEQEKQGKKVYILDANASIYMMPINKTNRNYDLFLIGNLGSKGEEGEIEKLEKIGDNTILLTLNNKYSKNWQTPMKVINYVTTNWVKIGEIEWFDIYTNMP